MGTDYYKKAVVTNKTTDDVYTILFDDAVEQTVTNVNELLIYFPCDNC
jgi:hypothetical protein